MKKEYKTPPNVYEDKLFFDGRQFWHPHPVSVWESLSTDGASRLLRVAYNLSGKRPDNRASEIDKALRYAEQNNRIVAGAPFVHDSRKIIEWHGGKYLNTSVVKCVQPAETGDPKHWPWLSEVYENIWAEPM